MTVTALSPADIAAHGASSYVRRAAGAVHNFDNYGSFWGTSTVADAMAMIVQARLDGDRIDEWYVTDRAGQPLRIVRIADPEFLDTISVIPASL